VQIELLAHCVSLAGDWLPEVGRFTMATIQFAPFCDFLEIPFGRHRPLGKIRVDLLVVFNVCRSRTRLEGIGMVRFSESFGLKPIAGFAFTVKVPAVRSTSFQVANTTSHSRNPVPRKNWNTSRSAARENCFYPTDINCATLGTKAQRKQRRTSSMVSPLVTEERHIMACAPGAPTSSEYCVAYSQC